MGAKFCGCNDSDTNKNEANLGVEGTPNENEEEIKEGDDANNFEKKNLLTEDQKENINFYYNASFKNRDEQKNFDSIYKMHSNDYNYSEKTHSYKQGDGNNEDLEEMEENNENLIDKKLRVGNKRNGEEENNFNKNSLNNKENEIQNNNQEYLEISDSYHKDNPINNKYSEENQNKEEEEKEEEKEPEKEEEYELNIESNNQNKKEKEIKFSKNVTYLDADKIITTQKEPNNEYLMKNVHITSDNNNDKDKNIRNQNEEENNLEDQNEEENKNKSKEISNVRGKNKRNNNIEKENEEEELDNNENENQKEEPENNDLLQDANKSISGLPILTKVLQEESQKSFMIQDNFGVKEFKDGSVYTGEIQNDKCNGRGKLKTGDNSLIYGFYKDNCLNGYVIIKHSSGSIFEGETTNNCFEGIGIENFADGASYFGEYKDNNKNGIGTYEWKNIAIYQGEWNNNKMEGYGIIKYSDGRIYEGEWKNNMFNGLGIFKWTDGKKYLGLYENDLRNGFGIFFWKKNLKIFIGFWKDGKQSGYGKVVKSNGESYGLYYESKKIKRYSKKKFIEEVKNNKNNDISKYIKYFDIDLEQGLSIMG